MPESTGINLIIDTNTEEKIIKCDRNEIERELSFIKSSEEIVSIFTKKIEQKINEVWGE